MSEKTLSQNMDQPPLGGYFFVHFVETSQKMFWKI